MKFSLKPLLFVFFSSLCCFGCNNNGKSIEVYFVDSNPEKYEFGTKTLYSTNVKEGELPVFKGETPTRDSKTDDYSLVFSGWDQKIVPASIYRHNRYLAKYDPVSSNVVIYINTPKDNTVFSLNYLGNNYFVDWGDGQQDRSNSHTFVRSGEYRIVIYGQITKITVLAPLIVTKCVTSFSLTDFNFNNCINIEEIVLSLSSYKEIPNNYFEKLEKLKKCNIPSNVKSIGDNAFYNCSSLEINNGLPIELESIGDNAFYNCKYLFEDFNYDGKYVRGLTFQYLYNLKHIGDYAFYNCSFSKYKHYSESSIIAGFFPDNDLEIGEYAFSRASMDYLSLKSKTLFKDTSFSKLTLNLEGDVYVSNDNPYYYTEEGCIINRATKSVIIGCGRCSSIPTGVVKINDYAFYNSKNTTNKEIYIPSYVANVGKEVFGHSIYKSVKCQAPSKPDGWDNDWSLNYSGEILWNQSPVI